jgi:REP-associated tyrosine transposase
MSSWLSSTAKPTTCTCWWPNPPTLAISTLVQRPKGRTAYAVRREFTGACVRARMRGHVWSPSYFAVSCGGAPLSIIKQYSNGHARPL